MIRRWCVGLFVAALFVGLASTEARAQVNPGGWIQWDGWNMLFPLGNPDGCGGGGTAKMAGNWVAPHQIGLEDPKAGTQWKDIQFGGAALATSWGGTGLNKDPIWVTNALLESSFPGLDMPNGDVIDFQNAVDVLNGVIAGLPGPPPSLPGDNVVGLATTYVENLTGAPLPVVICSASDDSVAVYVNNLLVTNVSSCRGTAGDCAERYPALLPVGVSKIAVLVWEGGGGWGFRLAVEVGGAKQNDTSASIRFLGAGTANTKGQIQYAATRSIAMDPFLCDNDTANVTLLGNAAKGADGDPVTVVENVYAYPASVTNVSDGGVVEDIASPVGIFTDHRVAGTAPCGGASTTTFNDGGTPADPTDDEYTSVSNTGKDIWDAGDANNDSFEFAYARLQGNFDVAIMITGKSNTTATRWGKWGLMARWNLDRAARYTIMQDHSNDPQDPCRLAGRTVHLAGGNMYEDVQGSGDPALDHPMFMRLKRSGNVFSGYISNDPGVIANPGDGGPWFKVGRDDDWGGSAPSEVLVGFANSQHNSGGCGVQTVKFKLIGASATVAGGGAVGNRITWNVTRGTVNAGLDYTVSTTAATPLSISGEVVGESYITGAASASLTTIPRTGPVGLFDDSHDIGTPPTRGLTTFDAVSATYRTAGSGADIWDGGDDFQFAYKKVTGDFVAQCRITGIDDPAAGTRWGRFGLMARWTCRRDAKYSMCVELGSDEIDWPRHQFRLFNANNGNTRDYYQMNDGIMSSRRPPWMRLVRRGNAFYSYLAEDDAGKPLEWLLLGSDSAPSVPQDLLVGMGVQSHGSAGANLLTITYDNMSIQPLNACFDFEPLAFETSATNTAGITSVPYMPRQVTARIPAGTDDATRQADARANGGAGFGVKNRNWYWRDLSAGPVNLEGTTQLLWNNENRNFATAHLRYVFRGAARVFIAWDIRLVKGGGDNPNGTVDNGWFDFNNDAGTLNKQGWFRLTGPSDSDDATPNPDEIAVSGDTNFARGGVWYKDVAPGDVLDFLATGFTAGRSPYVVFVQCGQSCNTGDQLQLLTYESAADLGVVVQGGGYRPEVVGGRLRVTVQDVGGQANSVWYGVPDDAGAGGAPLLAEGFVAEFDAFMTRNGIPGDANPADGFAFAVVATGKSDGLASAVGPFPPGLDIATLRGDGGGAMSFDGFTMRERTDGHPSFAVEMDNWVGGGEPGNEPYANSGSPDFDGRYHMGVDINASVSSIQTNVDFGVPGTSMPYIFSPNGIHVEVQYRANGAIRAWVSGVDAAGAPVPRTQVLSAFISPMPLGDVVLGFVGGTGGATCTQEIDNFKVSTLCCEQPDTVSVAGDATANEGQTKKYTASLAGAELGGAVSYSWSVVSGSATIAGSGASVDVTFGSAGTTVLGVAANDGTCLGTTTQIAVQVTAATCTTAIAPTVDEAGVVTLNLTVNGAPFPDCNCDDVVILRDGQEIYRGPRATAPATDTLPAECEEPTQVVYQVACIGPVGQGAAASGTVTCPVRSSPFIRGDCNQDGEVCRSVSDIVRMVEILFLGTAQTTCPAACDANGTNGFIADGLSDPLYLANFCFTGLNGPPPAPYPACGKLSQTDVERCDGPTFCKP